MGKIKTFIKKQGFPTSLVGIYHNKDKKELEITFPVMGKSHGFRQFNFPVTFGHKAIAKSVVDAMLWDEQF